MRQHVARKDQKRHRERRPGHRKLLSLKGPRSKNILRASMVKSRQNVPQHPPSPEKRSYPISPSSWFFLTGVALSVPFMFSPSGWVRVNPPWKGLEVKTSWERPSTKLVRTSLSILHHHEKRPYPIPPSSWIFLNRGCSKRSFSVLSFRVG